MTPQTKSSICNSDSLQSNLVRRSWNHANPLTVEPDSPDSAILLHEEDDVGVIEPALINFTKSETVYSQMFQLGGGE